jgi:hypothetical protein
MKEHLWVVGAIGAMSVVAWGQPVTDREQLIDVGSLKRAMERATEPIAERLRTSKLKEKFGQINELLAEDEVDKERLINAIRNLQGEIAVFTSDWDGEVADPLWDAQEVVASTIDRVRQLLASKSGAAPSAEARKMMQAYDDRLRQLAVAIQAEQDEIRRERLKVVFANIRALRDVVEKAGTIDLTSAREAIYVKTIRALAALEVQLTNATFEMERVRIVLDAERAFLGNYVAILEGLVEAESLAMMLSSVEPGGIAGLSGGLDELGVQMTALGEEMDGFVGTLAESIELEAARVSEGGPIHQAATNIDLDAEIARYAADAAKKAAEAETGDEP